MKIELRWDGETVKVGALDSEIGLVATGEAKTLPDAVRALVSRFATMQQATIEALNESGIIHYVVGGDSETTS